jgi:hypothetical protein
MSVSSLAQAVPEPGHPWSLTRWLRPDRASILYTFVT